MPDQISAGDWVRHTAALPRLADISTVGQAAKAMPDEEMQPEIEDFLEGFNQPTYRGMRVNGVRVHTSSSQQMHERAEVAQHEETTRKGLLRENAPYGAEE
jgi:hypothetical protein